MNWAIYRINDYSNLSTAEAQAWSRGLNSYALFTINYKNDSSRLSTFKQLQWKHNNSPRSEPNTHSVNNNGNIVLQRRANRAMQDLTFLTTHCALKSMHGDLGMYLLVAWKNRYRHLNDREPHENFEMDSDVLETYALDTQLIILTISLLNMEKLFHLKLQRSNMDRNVSDSKALCDRFTSLPRKVKMKRKTVAKMSMGLSLVFIYLVQRFLLHSLNQKGFFLF